ncbi:unnamed protein product [Bursaphelenchus xylophilus]|uniref:(pine wood nematode) hypothetical protein n=1 Tax=Bursaphelenchus xylophilus TaxID=6326 RepID=A0A1I7RLB5_BURXY|nr:unnamed protein product [Bursaphelenchus xylophilus]CAG9083199.1 unnamed protein product [Bursaphelenchus xylophilus]
MRLIFLSLALLAPVSAIFFGGGGGGCGCAPPPPPCPPPQPCGCGGGASYGASYAAPPVAAPCQPRYVIVRPVESGPSYASGPVGGGYAQPVAAPSYAAPQIAQGYAAPVAGPTYAAPAPVAAPVASYATGGEGVAAAAAAYASKTLNAEGKCSNKELRKILEKEIVAGDANESKRNVYKVANQQFSDANSDKGIDVICAPALISYRVATDFYCEYTKEDITCFAFQQA